MSNPEMERPALRHTGHPENTPTDERECIPPPRLSEADQILANARRWYDREIERSSAALGPKWPKHREWVEDYLREDLRQRLAARGWSPSP